MLPWKTLGSGHLRDTKEAEDNVTQTALSEQVTLSPAVMAKQLHARQRYTITLVLRKNLQSCMVHDSLATLGDWSIASSLWSKFHSVTGENQARREPVLYNRDQFETPGILRDVSFTTPLWSKLSEQSIYTL